MKPADGSRDLALAAAIVIGLSRFVNGPLVWAIGALLLAGVMLAALQLIGDADPAGATAGIPIESVMAPGLAAVAGVGALRLVPIGLLLVPALVLAAWFIRLVLSTETRIARATAPPSSSDRTAILVQGLIAAFGAFVGIAILVMGALPDATATDTPPATLGDLALLAVADGTVAFLLGYRIAALRSTNMRDVVWAASTAAGVVAIAAAIFRSIQIPSLLGPALLIIVLFLWDAIHGSAPVRRDDPRRIWEAVLLLVLGLIVVGWTLGLRA